VTTELSATPSFDDLLARGQHLISQLVALQEELARELADQQTELSQSRAQQGQLQEELEALRSQRQQSTAERERLVKEGERLHQEHEQLKELHAQVTEQANLLAAEWNARREALAAESQQLRAEVEHTRTNLDLSQEREKQWQVQVRKLQDEGTKLGDAVGRVTLTDEQSFQLHSQLNAIVGFADVLLDEAGNRATAAEHQEYLQHIKDSGARLAGYVHQLTTAPNDGSIPSQAAGVQIPLGPPGARWGAQTVLVADTEAAVRERIEAFLSGAGYQVAFASDTQEALKTAARLQPLAIMIDAALQPNGAMGLVDELLREPRTRDIPVVLTVRDDQELLGLNIGHYDFLTKPIDQQQVQQMMVKYDLLGERRRANKMPASVLVVDDDRRNTRLVEAMLKPFKIEVLVADGGAAGIKLAAERRPDLIILDLMMPNVDGFEVVSALRKDSATSQIPILIYTAKKITSDDRRRLQGSIQSIIGKGEFGKEKFLELVYRRGERRNRTSPSETAA
jgi:CheY-like chemotaxis protein